MAGTDWLIRNNICDRNNGNGILVEEGFRIVVENNRCRFNKGDAKGWGCGGIWVDAGEDVIVRNNGQGKFIDVARQSGPYFDEKHVGRGAAAADFDNDGDIDLLVMNLNGPAKLLENVGGNENHWLTVAPKLTAGGADALGARVTIPMHYNTFDVIQADPAQFVTQVEAHGGKAVVVPPGSGHEIA